jgi:hypothetical protein
VGLLNSAEVLIPVSVLVFVAAMVAVVFHRLICPKSSLPATAGWIEELSVNRYAPMLWLLDRRAIGSLRSRQGFTPSMEKKFRRKQCRIFHAYLRHLTATFGRMTLALKLVMLHSPHDRPDLAKTLIRSQVAFAVGLLFVHAKVALYRMGVGSGNASRLLLLFESIRAELRLSIPASAPADGVSL